jgi:hypothetical protein
MSVDVTRVQSGGLAFPPTAIDVDDQELRASRIPFADPIYFEALQWLVEEAEALDEGRLDDWTTSFTGCRFELPFTVVTATVSSARWVTSKRTFSR